MLKNAEITVENTKKTLGLIIFDCDGVLVDSEIMSIDALHNLIINQGGDLTKGDVVELFQGRSIKSAQEELFALQGVELTQESLNYMNQQLFKHFKEKLLPVSGVEEFIKSLDLPYCVASSSQPERINVSLAVTELGHYFDDRVFSSTMVKKGKPAPDLFLYAAEKMNISAENVLVIEDSPAGVLAARRAGMRCIGLTAGSHATHSDYREKLLTAGAEWVVEDYKSVEALIKMLLKA